MEWAEKDDADWMIFEDSDCRPNYLVKQDYRNIMKNTDKDFIYITRLYIWGYDQYFPELSTPTGNWTPSLWAFRLHRGVRFDEDEPLRTSWQYPTDKKEAILNLMPPYCLLHYAWPDEEEVQRKIEFYNATREEDWCGLVHPLKGFGKLEPLPDWAKE